jgi:2-haloacid dehalogenase
MLLLPSTHESMPAPAYPIVLFDLDHTLFDSDESERLAFNATLRAFSIEHPERHFGRYRSINRALWSQVEAGRIDVDGVRVERFRRLVARSPFDLDPVALSDRYVVELGANGDLYAGAREVLDSVSTRARIGLITNGLGEVQRARLGRVGLDEVFETVVISGEVGVAKPDPRIFDIAFAELDHPERSEALMVGDSLTSDIAGGSAYGLATCWLNRHGADVPDTVTHAIEDLTGLERLLDPAMT